MAENYAVRARLRAARRFSARRSSSESPPQTPASCPLSNAHCRQGACTGQRAHTALASSIWAKAGPVLPIGKKSSGSSSRQAESCRQSIANRSLSGALSAAKDPTWWWSSHETLQRNMLFLRGIPSSANSWRTVVCGEGASQTFQLSGSQGVHSRVTGRFAGFSRVILISQSDRNGHLAHFIASS